MRRLGTLVAAAGVLGWGLAVVPAGAAPIGAPAGNYIVTLNDGQDGAALAASVGATPTHVYRAAIDGFSDSLTSDQVGRLNADPRVVSVVPDQVAHLDDAPDPSRPTPELIPFGAKRIGTLQSPTAHANHVEDPMNVDVAVIDSGVYSAHPDLNVAGGYNCSHDLGENGDQGYEDIFGHGTHVSGIIGMRDNGYGFIGVAPGARIWAIRVIDRNEDATMSEVICGVDWVTAHANVIDVANMSLGFIGGDDGKCGRSHHTHDPLHLAICRSIAAGVTYAVAAGNNAVDARTETPAAYREVLTVSAMVDFDGQPGGLAPNPGGDSGCGSTTVDDTFAYFSNYGPAIDLAAPGVCITSALLATDTHPFYGSLSGTSMASPHVAGAAALWRAAHPTATPKQVRGALIRHGERTVLPGDPDNKHERIVNVAGF